MTQQGIATSKQSNQHREVHDKTYYMNLYKKRMEALDYELISLDSKLKQTSELDQIELNQRLLKAENEVKQWHDQLQILNILLEKQRTALTIDDLERDLMKIKKNRENDMEQVELLYAQKQDKEAKVNALNKTVLLLQDEMDSVMQESSYHQQYIDKSNKIETNISNAEALKMQSKQLKSQIDIISLKIEGKGDVYKDYKSKLLEATRKSIELQRIHQKPKQQDLAKLVQQTQFELTVLEQQVEQTLRNSELENTRSQHNQAIQSENEMTAFINQFLVEKSQAEQELINIKNEINDLNDILASPAPTELPTLDKYQEMQQLLSIKQVEVNTAEMTFESLQKEKSERETEIYKLESLGAKIDEEIVKLTKQSTDIDDKVTEYVNMDETKRKLEIQKRDLLQKRDEIELLISAVNPVVAELEHAMTQVQNKLAMDTQHSEYIALLMKMNSLRMKIINSNSCKY